MHFDLDPFVDGGVGDHAVRLRHLHLAGLELWLHEQHQVTAGKRRTDEWVEHAAERDERQVGDHDVEHMPIRTNEPGLVQVWPLCASTKEEVDTTDLEGKRATLALPHERLAQLIAVHAKSLIDGKERRPRDGELLHPGHFMVLVRRRNEFVNALVRALKRQSIEVAGVDRLDLAQELAIQDLLAMARFVLLPQDDLNLACLLKSPLIGLEEEIGRAHV